MLIDMNNNLEYRQMLEAVNLFISENGLTGVKRALELRRLVERAAYLEPMIQITVDASDNQVTAFFPGVTEISRTIKSVPFIEVSADTGWLTLWHRIGFIRDRWHFFERSSVNISGEIVSTINHVFDDITRTALAEGAITEHLTQEGLFSHLRDVGGPDDVVILRFTNRDGENLYHTLTDAEINAILVLDEIRSLHRRIRRSILNLGIVSK